MTRYYVWTMHSIETAPFTAYPYSYTYALEADDEDAARARVHDLLVEERTCHTHACTIAYGRVSLPGEASYEHSAVGYFQQGLMTAYGSTYGEPTYCAAITWTNGGRPVGRKLLRPGLAPLDIAGSGELALPHLELVQEYARWVADAGDWYTRGDVLITGWRVDTRVHYHRLRNGTFRRRFVHI